MEKLENKEKKVLFDLKQIICEIEQREGKSLDTNKVTCGHCEASGEIKDIIVPDNGGNSLRCKKCGVVTYFYFENIIRFLEEISEKSGYTPNGILAYLILRNQFRKLIKDERIANLLSQLGIRGSTRTALNYSAKSKKKVSLSKGNYHMMENCLNTEIPIRLMIALVKEALIKGKSELTVKTRVYGYVMPDHTRDDNTAEKVCKVNIRLNLESNKPVLDFNPPAEFYRLLD